MSNEYWQERIAKSQEAITNKKTKDIEKQMIKYYRQTAKNCIKEFEATYDKLMATVEAGRSITPADLYKLDKYWIMQGNMRKELEKLGDYQIALLSDEFMSEFYDIYHSFALDGTEVFNTYDANAAKQMINSIWVADGKSWSARVWENTERLADTLNEGLIDIAVSGKTTRDLKDTLQYRFDVSYSAADSIVRTELAHIQTQAARQRYEDMGVKEVEILADEDERRCDICGKLHGKRYPVGANIPVPAHPRCRCCILPVIDI